MNPFREPGAVDKTEIEVAKIREAEETRRKEIAEREATKRKKLETRQFEFLSPHQAILVGFLAALVCGAFAYVNRLDATEPRACVESVEVVNPATRVRECPRGARLETSDAPEGRVVVRCRCGVDGGAP